MQKNINTRNVNKNFVYYLVLILFAFLDAAFKIYANIRLPEYGSLWFLDFFLFKNYGIAFCIKIPLVAVAIISVILIFLFIYFILCSKTANKYQKIGAFSVVLGATGNFVDRIINGYTTDYIIFFQTSAINLSDILILFGVFIILYYSKER
ncbi:signal peptidase II [Patescibacteria group bacterium]|nr:signal peptidase II [Patescibacteria group bacterium]